MKSGINRVSIGLQSTDDDILRKIGRIHKYDDFLQTYNMAREVGFKNINVDLMLALPGQTVLKLKQGLKQIIALKPEHISLYSLILEEGTVLNKKVQNKEIELPDEDDERKMYWETKRILEEAGYIHYEISNFAKQGYESRHNTNYWRCGEYIGIGPSAHSFFDGKRFFYSRSMDDFNNNKLSFEGTGGDEEEFIMLSLRLKSGLNYSEFEEKFGYTLPSYIIKKAKEYEKYGYTNVTDKSISFTPKGFLVSNSIISELI